MNTDVRL